MQNLPWDKIGKGSTVGVPVLGLIWFVVSMLSGAIDAKADKDVTLLSHQNVLEKVATKADQIAMENLASSVGSKADKVAVEGLASEVAKQGERIESLQKEQRIQGDKLTEINTRQEEVIRGQDRILKALQENGNHGG
jgi:hypothetical protein